MNWSRQVTGVGGVTAPKKMTVLCSDGKEYAQLLKGKDDLRQDAIMQQVFTILNEMLRHNMETKKRNINIKTYKVVPLSQRSGILEWYSGSIPLSTYLTGTGKTPGAHQKYRPTDLHPAKCRQAILVSFSIWILKYNI